MTTILTFVDYALQEHAHTRMSYACHPAGPY